MSPKVSVIIPFYNNGDVIDRCLRSMEEQTVMKDEFQIIIVDDGSSSEFIRPTLDKDLQMVCLRHSVNCGLPAALNTALKNCHTQFFVRVDSDDFVHKNFLELLLLKMNLSPGILGAACDYWSVDRFEKRISEHNSMIDPIGCGIIFKTEVLKSVGYYSENMLMAEEIEFRKRVDSVGTVGHLSVPLYRYVRHEKNMTNDFARYRQYKDLIK